MTHEKLFTLRGGASAGPLNPDIMTKILMGIYTVQGLHVSLAPEKVRDTYGLDPKLNSELCTYIMECTGESMLGLAIVGYAIHCKGVDVNTAMAYAAIPSFLVLLKGFLNQTQAKFGLSTAGWNFFLIVSTIVIYGGLTGADWSTNAFKAISIITLLTGLWGTLAPKSQMDGWGISNPKGFEVAQNNVNAGWTLSKSVCFLSLLNGNDINTAFAHSALCTALWCINGQFISKWWPEGQGQEPGIIIAWIVVLLAHAATQLL